MLKAQADPSISIFVGVIVIQLRRRQNSVYARGKRLCFDGYLYKKKDMCDKYIVVTK